MRRRAKLGLSQASMSHCFKLNSAPCHVGGSTRQHFAQSNSNPLTIVVRSDFVLPRLLRQLRAQRLHFIVEALDGPVRERHRRVGAGPGGGAATAHAAMSRAERRGRRGFRERFEDAAVAMHT